MTTHIARRAVLAMGAAPWAALAGAAAQIPADHVHQQARDEHLRSMTQLPPDAPKVAMLVHPKMVALDLIGPLTVFKVLRFDVQLVWKDRGPVSTDVGLALMPTHTFAESFHEPDILFVPGGTLGTIDCINDEAVCAYVVGAD